MTRVYLAGPTRHVSDNGKGWRDRIKRKYQGELTLVDPVEYLDEDDDTTQTEVAQVDDDLALLDTCDAVVAKVLLDTPSRGTTVEMWEASKHLDKFVVGCLDMDYSEYSIFVKSAIDEYAYSVGTSLELIENKVKQ